MFRYHRFDPICVDPVCVNPACVNPACLNQCLWTGRGFCADTGCDTVASLLFKQHLPFPANMSKNVFDNILGTIGNTPLVRLNRITGDIKATVFAKVETFNPGHSIKDRMALKMIEDAEAQGLLKPGGTIIEGTSGNTGMGLAIVGIVKGYKCIFTTTDKQSPEKKRCAARFRGRGDCVPD